MPQMVQPGTMQMMQVPGQMQIPGTMQMMQVPGTNAGSRCGDNYCSATKHATIAEPEPEHGVPDDAAAEHAQQHPELDRVDRQRQGQGEVRRKTVAGGRGDGGTSAE